MHANPAVESNAKQRVVWKVTTGLGLRIDITAIAVRAETPEKVAISFAAGEMFQNDGNTTEFTTPSMEKRMESPKHAESVFRISIFCPSGFTVRILSKELLNWNLLSFRFSPCWGERAGFTLRDVMKNRLPNIIVLPSKSFDCRKGGHMKTRDFHGGLTRRAFLGGGIGAGAIATLGALGCVPANESDIAHAATETTQPEWLGSAPEILESEIVDVVDTGVLIVGAGNAGLPAAATALELGVDFELCEKTGYVQTARGFVGVVNSKYTHEAGFEVDCQVLLNELARYASYKCNMDVIKVWINESAEAFEWLDHIMAEGKKWPMFQGPMLKDPFESGCGGGKYYVPPIQHQHVDDGFNAYSDPDRNKILRDFLEGNGKEIRYKHSLVKLERSDEGSGRVTGGIFETPQGYVRINASMGVLLATGGYPANPDMIKALQPFVPKVVTANGFMPSCDGYGIRAAMWVGADKQTEGTAMIFDRGGVRPGVSAGYRRDSRGKEMFPGEFTQVKLGTQPFLKVNREGKRFVNESCPYDFIAHAASEQDGGVWCQIFDSNAKQDIKRFNTTGCSNINATFVNTELSIDDYIADWKEAGIYWRADTLEELADMLGLPQEQFLETVNRYNELCENGLDEDYGKESYRLSYIKEPPFYGGWFGGNLLTTLDGVRINADMQVLDHRNNVIDGLYAAGDCSGSFFCNNYPEYFVGVAAGRTITFGRHAVRFMAGDIA